MAETSGDEPGAALAGGRPPLAHYESGWNTASFLPDSTLTFPEAFERRCKERPDAVAFQEVLWMPPSDPDTRPLTYTHLADRARRAGVCLESAGVTRGDRVLLCLQGPEMFFAYFLAAQALGAVPVPLPSAADAGRPAAFQERITAVAADCTPRAIVADDRRGLDVIGPEAAGSIALVDASATDDGARNSRGTAFSLRRSFDELAFIQYTSGSTGKPKGVVVTHYNLVSNLRSIAEAGRFGPDDRSVFWLPLYHDMGLIGGLLFGIYLGIPTYVMPPKSFVSRPDSWLRAIGRYRGTFTIGPNFAYNILAGRLPSSALAGIDLSSLRLAFNGAEPIDRSTVEAFIQRFSAYGFRATSLFPVYGMAETTLATAFPVPGAPVDFDTVDRNTLSLSKKAVPVAPEASNSVTFVSVGSSMPGHRLCIRSPDGPEELAERRVGEVVVSGPSVTTRYFGEGEASGERTELRTGDLGYIADGKLYIVDRLKDLVIVAGRNLVPTDIERVAATVEGVRYGAVVAFARPGPDGTEELCVIAGVEAHAMQAGDALRARIRAQIQEHFGVSPLEILLVEPRSIPKTSSGKIQRAACRQLHAAGAWVNGVRATS